MKTAKVYRTAGVLLAVLSFAVGTGAQNLYQLKFSGKSTGLDASGNETTRLVTDKTLVQDWSRRAGISDSKNLVLAFHRNVDSRGDAIEVVNKKTGESVTTVAPLFFPESAAATSPKGTTEKRFAYVYNLNHAEFSRGTAIMNETTSIKKGVTNKFAVNAEMQWYEVPEGTNGLRIIAGTFKASKQIK